MRYLFIPGLLAGFLFFQSCDTKKHGRDGEGTKSLKEFFGFSGEYDDIKVSDYADFSDSVKWPKELSTFYSLRQYRLAWIANKAVTRNAKELLNELRLSCKEGLSAELYKAAEAEAAVSALKKAKEGNDSLPRQLARLDLILTKAYLDYASDLLTGRINPEKLDLIWETYPKNLKLSEHLREALEEKKIARSLERLKPGYKQYRLLKDALSRFTSATSQNGLSPAGSIPALKEEDSGKDVVKLKKILLATGDLQQADSAYIKAPKFDRQLGRAVKNFQRRHGLKDDGLVSGNTLTEINRPLEERINQIRINLDRIRWLPEKLDEKFIIINIPAFSFHYYEKGEPALTMAVVVGKNEAYTPILNDSLRSVIFHPAWNVPASIATREMLPKIKEDTEYLTKNNYALLKGAYNSKDTIDPEEVDWSEITAEDFPFSIVLPPGKNNPLGKLEFMMQNQYNIYLHDTPADHLFERYQRNFSHGCIRLEKPVELAEILLKGQLSSDSIRKMLAENKKRSVTLREKIPVHMIYQTAWVDPKGQVQFRNDIYGFDKLSLPLLREKKQ